MTAIKKTNKIIYDTNLVANQTIIYVSRKNNAKQIGIDWKDKHEIFWEKYQIKESDMRVKTASFISPNYFDLTTGVHCILISSPFHEDFGGEILNVEYDEETGLYTYNCQDFSRDYQSKIDKVASKVKVHRILKFLLSRGGIGLKGKISKAKQKTYKKALSGLRPAWQYGQKEFGATFNFNPMTETRNLIMRNKSQIEVIRDLIYGSGSYIDVYVDKYGVVQIEPYHKNELYNTGLYLTTPEVASRQFKFDTTNVITGSIVSSTNQKKSGKFYSSESLINLDLSAFFGNLNSVVANPNKATTTTKSTKTKSSKKKSKNKKKNDNVYGTKKKNVYLNIDSINGYSSDMNKMKDIRKVLKKHGWNVTITGVGSEAHYQDRGKVKKGIWFCLYGGACAGTLKEHCTSDWFLNPLKRNKSRVVVGFFPPSADIRKGGSAYKWLPRAWDDGFSGGGFTGISYPSKMMSKNGVPFMYAKNGKEMANKFLAGGDNYKTSGKSYKNHDSWQKHNPKWIK